MAKQNTTDIETNSVEEYEKLANFHAVLAEFMVTPSVISDVDYNFKRQKLIYEIDKLWPNFEGICKNLGISLEYKSYVKLQERAEANFARTFCGNPLDTSECDATSKITLDRTKSVISDWSKSGTPKISIFGKSDAEYMQKLKQVFDEVLVRLHDVFGEKSAAGGKAGDARQVETGQKAERSIFMMQVRSSKENWEAIQNEYGTSKRDFGKKINFVSHKFKREIIFRDTEHAFVLASQGFSKPALILAGGVIEELLRLYLEHRKVKPKSKRFIDYIEACKKKPLLKSGVSSLTDSIRDFRNYVHLEKEKTKSDTILKTTAKGAVSSIFTIANDFQQESSN